MTEPIPLEQAPDHIKLAVDLIDILEQANLSKETILKALAIVKNDFEQHQE